jgi:hypothetical protein
MMSDILPSVLKVFRHVDFFCDTYQRTKNTNYLSVIKSIQVVNTAALTVGDTRRKLIAIRLGANSQADSEETITKHYPELEEG